MAARNHLAAALGMLALVSAVGAQPVLADEVVLANGDRLTGKIVRKEADTIVLTTSYAGDVTIQWREIRRITADGPVAVYFEDGSKLTGSMRPAGDGVVIVTAGALESDPTPLAKLRFLNPSAEVSGEGAKVTGHINAGLSSSSGNTQSKKFYLDTEGLIRSRDDRYTLGARALNSYDRGEETESSWLAYGKYDRFFTKKWYGYLNSDLENDKFKDIRLRGTIGLGSGYQFFESEKTNLSLEGGLTYVHTNFIVGEDESYPAARWALKFDHQLFGKVQFFHAHEAFVGLENNDQMFVRSQTGLRVPLMDRLNATAQYNVDWDNNPTLGRSQTDKTLLLTLGYTW
jgi:putative salt-induced outer membrane protein YdiY